VSLLNPMNIAGPNAAAPYQQPNTANPTPPKNQPAVASFAVGANNLQYPLPAISGGSTPLNNPPAGGIFPLGIFPHLTS
jgi:hypothetical protein